jgi:Ala-tRNA(Pro) deacylase
MDIRTFLSSNGIAYQWFDHPAVFTCEQSALLPPMPGADTKNLFLREEKGGRFFLVSVGHDKRVDLKALRKVLNARPLSFGSSEDLLRLLGVTPGSVTLLGLVHDAAHAVTVVIDIPLWQADAIRCHPLVNTASVVIPHADLEQFFVVTGHAPLIADVPAHACP